MMRYQDKTKRCKKCGANDWENLTKGIGIEKRFYQCKNCKEIVDNIHTYDAYFNAGKIGERIFEQWCENEGLEFLRSTKFLCILSIYYLNTIYNNKKGMNSEFYKKFKGKQIMSMFTKDEIDFLSKKFLMPVKDYNYGKGEPKIVTYNFELNGFPDYVVWNKEIGVKFIEIKTTVKGHSSVLTKIQKKILKSLSKHFNVEICHIKSNHKIKIKIDNVILNFINFKEYSKDNLKKFN